MSNKTTALTALSGVPAAGDLVPIVDVSDTTDSAAGTTKSIRWDSFPCKRYVALISQTGTDAPVATVLENTLGGTVVWTRGNIGNYTGTLASAFTQDKTILFMSAIHDGSSQNFHRFIWSTANTVIIRTYDSAYSPEDVLLVGNSIEIRVYA